jgi:DNA uptake protein ComE-like DNA-binding protein
MTPRRSSDLQSRSAVVLLSVLVVVVLLSLAAYQYSSLVVAELNATYNAHATVQARLFAESGVHYTAMVLASPDNIESVLGGNPYHNPDRFDGVPVAGGGDRVGGRFRLIAPLDADDGAGGMDYRSGVTDEGGKLNINALIKRDPSGDLLYEALLKLPNMTESIAAAIVDWVDVDSEPRNGGAEGEAYAGKYRCKNGPLDSIEELLLVQGVTRELLYGFDLNRNNLHDGDERNTDATNRGWIHYLTIYSREANRDALGNPLPYINSPDLATLYNDIALLAGEDLAKFVVLYRQYGASSDKGTQQSFGSSLAAIFGGKKGGNSKSGASSTPVIEAPLSAVQIDPLRRGTQKIRSFFDLIDVKVSVKSPDGKSTMLLTSPLKDPAAQRELLPKLYQVASLFQDAEIPARINVNTAPREVLLSLPDITEAEVDSIMSARPKLTSAQPAPEIFQTPTWLLTEAKLNASRLRTLEKYITTKSQVYRMQVEGYFEDGTGPRTRIEAVVDTNSGRPRIVLWRDLSELGRNPLPQ